MSALDVLLADLIVAALGASWWLLLLVPTFLAGHLLGRRSQRRGDRTDLAIAQLRADFERDRTTKALAHGAALAEDVVAMQVQFQRIGDQLALIELEASTDWEGEGR